MKAPKLSFIIPAYNEEGSVVLLHKKLTQEIKKLRKSYEIIFVDDGSTDKTPQKLDNIQKKDKKVSVITFRGNQGKSAALQAGFNNAQGEVIFTMDADLQDNPKDITKFLKKLDKGYDLVTGWKKVRHDPWHKVLPSRILNNFLIPTLTGLKIHDNNCGYKAYRTEVVKELNLYGELYRFIPILASKNNFKVTEIPVSHSPRKFGKSKFGVERNIKGLLDLLTVFFLTSYLKRPGHFFGSLGLVSFGTGFAIGLYITYLRITTGSIQYRHPLLFFGMLLMIIGVQLVTTGLLAEMIVSFHQKRGQSSSK